MNNFIYKIIFIINWKFKILPVIIQNKYNKNIVMFAWINKWCFIENFFFKKTCFWSRSKKNFWRKGNFSNNIQIINKIYFDCDIDVFIFKILCFNNNCHYNNYSCFNYYL